MESVFSKMHETLKRNFKRRAGGTRYFSNLHRGEGAELRADMNSTDLARQRSAVKRVIASMTLGRDVSNLFIEVVKLGQTNNLELKKLVYLYVLNTAKLQPEKALMAINTFLQDTRHTNPIVRALAVRTMLCVRVSSVMEYALEPLRRATHDSNPYVRKAAAIGIGKVFHQNMKYFYDHGLFDDLMKLLSDNDAMVVANTAAVLAEVRDFGTEKLTLQFKCHTIALRRLVGANEWGKIYLLELLTMNLPSDPAAPKLLAESVLPLLHHENPAVVMGAIKCLVTCASRSEANMIEVFSTRINAALLNLLQEEPETQFVVCRNIHSLIVVFPTLMRSNLDALYVHFNDPPYLKLEKVRLLSKLVTPETSAAVLDELVEYTKDVDFLFVQKVIEAIALTAINTNMVADIGAALRRVLSYKPNAFAEVLMAIRDILGRCAEVPDVQARLTDIVEEFSPDMILEEEPKCALLWLVASGFQGFTVEARREVFRYYVETLISQEPSVQLATLCTAITLFNSPNPEVDQATVRQVLDSLATRATSPDVRDRSISMHRLLSKGNRDLMRAIAESTRESIHAQQTFNDAMTMGDLKRSINTAAAVFFRPFYTFLPPYGIGDLDDVTTNNGSAMRDMSSEDDSPESATAGGGSENVSAASPAAYADPLDDLFGSSSPATPDAGQQAAAQSAPVGFNTATVGGMSNAVDDLFGA